MQDLENLVSTNGSISQEKAINWLIYLVKQLQQIHQDNKIYAMINPNNILCKDDGSVLLFSHKTEIPIDQPNPGGINFPVYTAPEAANGGKASPQWDFFALGRTFVYSLTGINAVNLFSIQQSDKIIWQENINISPHFVSILEKMIALDPNNRFQNTQQILSELNKLNSILFLPQKNIVSSKYRRSKIWLFLYVFIAFLAGILISKFIKFPLVVPQLFFYKTPTTPILSSNTPTTPILSSNTSTTPILSSNTSTTPILSSNKLNVHDFPSGNFYHAGSTSWVPITSQLDSEIHHYRNDVKIQNIDLNNQQVEGSDIGIKMLLNEKIAFALSSRRLTDDEHKEGLEEFLVAYDAIAVIVPKELNVSNLSLEQLKDIYTTRIGMKWSKFGGPDLDIKPYSRKSQISGTADVFQQDVLKGEKFSENVKYWNNTTNAISQMKPSEGSIYYASAAETVLQCSVHSLRLKNLSGNYISPYDPLHFVAPQDCTPNNKNKVNIDAIKNHEYPLIRPIFIVINHKNKVSEKVGTAYYRLLLTEQGRELIKDTGFSPY